MPKVSWAKRKLFWPDFELITRVCGGCSVCVWQRDKTVHE
jgi:hypothetical protein